MHKCSIDHRLRLLDWPRLEQRLNDRGYAVIDDLLSQAQCTELSRLYTDETLYRTRIDMRQYGFGQGEYQYFDYPLPCLVQALRSALYPRLVPTANRWNESMGIAVRFPDQHREFIQRCWEAGQRRPTPLMLDYTEGDFNCLHQDLYGEHVFPVQATVLLSSPGVDFSGGEFVLTEQTPRRQSRVEVVPLRRGDAVIFAVRERPILGKRGYYRASMRHGVSRLRSGSRRTLGIIFHDAQ